MDQRIVVGIEDEVLRGQLVASLKERDWEITVCDGLESLRQELEAGGFSAVIGGLEGNWLVGEQLMAEALAEDLFAQVILLGEEVSVRTAVDLVKSGAGDVVDLGLEGLSGVIQAVEICLRERREDMALVAGEDVGLN